LPVSIATAFTASSATFSAGGLLGLLGATAVSWPVVLVGGSVALGHADFFGTAGQFSIGANSHLLLHNNDFYRIS
jgi:hypothetical protein